MGTIRDKNSTEKQIMTEIIEAVRESVKFCRREIGEETPPKFCARPIKHVNAHHWCDECRAERLPFWPAGGPVEPVAASEPVPAPAAAVEPEPLTPGHLEAV